MEVMPSDVPRTCILPISWWKTLVLRDPSFSDKPEGQEVCKVLGFHRPGCHF